MSIVQKVSPAIGNGPEAMRTIASAVNRVIDLVQPMGTLITTVGSSVTVGETYGNYLASTAVTYHMPLAAAHAGRKYSIMKVDAGVGIVKADGSGSETINGSITIQTATQYDGWTLLSDGTQWVVVK